MLEKVVRVFWLAIAVAVLSLGLYVLIAVMISLLMNKVFT
jgi:hypothetical protein